MTLFLLGAVFGAICLAPLTFVLMARWIGSGR